MFKDGTLKIIDFGSACSGREARECTIYKKTTPRVASPESLCCKKYDAFSADIWALGILLIRMITGGKQKIIVIAIIINSFN
jgi:serine/threonine protein kinase